jgi:glutamate mutase epsilon subunit
MNISRTSNTTADISIAVHKWLDRAAGIDTGCGARVGRRTYAPIVDGTSVREATAGSATAFRRDDR